MAQYIDQSIVNILYVVVTIPKIAFMKLIPSLK